MNSDFVAPRQLILIGAGASYGSQSLGPVPALGANLFDALCAIDPNNWANLPDEVQEAFRADFERGWNAFDGHRVFTSVLLRSLALYFLGFRVSTDSLFVELGRRIKRSGWRGGFASLNYDRMLVDGLLSTGNSVEISHPETADSIRVNLPHGACFLFCDGGSGGPGGLSISRNGTINFQGRASLFIGRDGVHFSNPDGWIDGDPVLIKDRNANAQRLIHDTMPPAMSYFEEGKRANAGESFLRGLRQQLAWLIESAETVAIVGVQVREHDRHIWGPLAHTGARLVYCGGPTGAQTFDGWKRAYRRDRNDVTLPGYFREEFENICRLTAITQ